MTWDTPVINTIYKSHGRQVLVVNQFYGETYSHNTNSDSHLCGATRNSIYKIVLFPTIRCPTTFIHPARQ